MLFRGLKFTVQIHSLHLSKRKSLKEIRLYSEKHNKKIINIRKYNDNGFSFLQKLFQYAGRSVAPKVQVVCFPFKALPFYKSWLYDKVFLRKVPYCY